MINYVEKKEKLIGSAIFEAGTREGTKCLES
jgi:hypothetical protein